ncbi:tetratricopeptide repeat protein [Arenimonas sp. SCN 70-307]|uniref:tetratricopeptide repeat protein n=1 Tax=Arenimonas sp. SCN 70-307 TaxID=1660089 RepID=UPI000B20B6CB|nr:tetratricopeptide repeat protein [Arenimonas sp. SCN 70-307]
MEPGSTESPGGRGAERYRFGAVVVDVPAHELSRDGELRPLEPKAFAVLVELLRHHGELLTRDQLLDAVWGHRHVTPGVLTRAIAQVRAALGDETQAPRFIQTQHALGYRFIAPLEPDAPEPDLLPAPAPMPAPPPAGASQRGAPAARLGRRSADRWRHWRWAVASAAALALAWLVLAQMRTAPAPAEASVAVLPFDALGGSADDKAYAEGLAREMLAALAGVDGLRVAAWRPREALAAGGGPVDVGRQLGVAAVLEANLRREQGRLRVTAQLSDTQTGFTLWSGNFDREPERVFDVQAEIAAEVARVLVGPLPDAGEGLRRRLAPTRDLAAFEQYLGGLRLLQAGAGEAAKQRFEQALVRDERFARAQAGICRAELWRFEGHRDASAFESARLACLRAANMDGTLGSVQLALGDLYRAAGDAPRAREHYQRAQADASVLAQALAGEAKLAAAAGDQAAALELFGQALQASPDDAHLHADLGFQRYLSGDLAGAIEALGRASELRPDNPHVWSTLGSLLAAAGRNEEAIVALERSLAIEPLEAVLNNLGTLRLQAGDGKGAALHYRQAVQLNPNNPELWGNLADVLAASGAPGDEAREAYGEAARRMGEFLAMKPDDAKAQALLAWYLCNLGDYEAARRALARADAIDQQQAEVALLAAQVFASTGELEAARTRIDAARSAGMAEVRINTNLFLQRAGLVPATPAQG